ncbi:MAG: hypothetical protein AAGE52_33475 [Myxococcota bacterium]
MWKLYRVLNESHEQVSIEELGVQALTYDPSTKAVVGENGPVTGKQLVTARKDGREVTLFHLEGHGALRFCFEAGPALPQEETERAKGFIAGLNDVIPDVTEYHCTVTRAYEQGEVLIVVYDFNHEEGKGYTAAASTSLSDEEMEQEFIRQINSDARSLFEGDNYDDY